MSLERLQVAARATLSATGDVDLVGFPFLVDFRVAAGATMAGVAATVFLVGFPMLQNSCSSNQQRNNLKINVQLLNRKISNNTKSKIQNR